MIRTVVAVDQDGRLEAARELCDRFGLSLYVDEVRLSCTHGWLAALQEALSKASGPGELVMLLSDDSELSDDFLEVSEEFGWICAKLGCFGDMQANHVLAASAHRDGVGLYTTPEGCAAFGVVATAGLWSEWLNSKLVELAGVHGLVFDEMINVWSMMNRREILKPTMSAVEHRLDFKSLVGNDNQEKNIRRTTHFDPSHEHKLGSNVANLGRSYESNHWRFLWALRSIPSLRKSLKTVVYEVERRAPSADYRVSPLALMSPA